MISEAPPIVLVQAVYNYKGKNNDEVGAYRDASYSKNSNMNYNYLWLFSSTLRKETS